LGIKPKIDRVYSFVDAVGRDIKMSETGYSVFPRTPKLKYTQEPFKKFQVFCHKARDRGKNPR
jgi:hypothetical protein